MSQPPDRRPTARLSGLFLLSLVLVPPAAARAQEGGHDPDLPLFRITREAVAGGAELLTVTGRVDAGLSDREDAGDVPLVSVLRDTLGDLDEENNRLRYVWVHGYTRPSGMQRVASAIPFLNRRTGNKDASGEASLPPPIIDLAAPAHDVWKDVLWMAAQSVLFDPYGALAKTSVRAFRRNGDDYRNAHIIRALAVLSLYEADTGASPALSPVEMRDIQARLVLAQKAFGGIVDDGYLQRVYEREIASSRDVRGHNWELLRQRVEAEGLYFEPLRMPDGSETHALVWVARHEVEIGARAFDGRFLNIASPWRDDRLLAWDGYSETRYFDGEDRPVAADHPGARAVELIPLALYGLDHPKIPAVLVDFRDHANPKRRELSRRVLNDVTRHVLSLSPYGDVHYFLGRTIYSFVTGRRGMDVNQPSRLRSYSQLKLLLSLSSSIDPELASEAERLIERVSMNPLQNDRDVEIDLALRSYDALASDARDPDGELASRLAGDRHAEYARLQHGRTARVFLRMATILTAGIYRHREPAPREEQLARLDVSRRLAYHQRFLEDVLASTPVIEVVWNLEDVQRSLQYVADHAEADPDTAVELAEAVFDRTADRQTRRLSLDLLARAGGDASRAALARIHDVPGLEPDLRALSQPALNGRSESGTPFDEDQSRARGSDAP
jgi:hypothetical protein